MNENHYPLKSPPFQKNGCKYDDYGNSDRTIEHEHENGPKQHKENEETSGNRRPYLSLSERLTQVWLNYYTICLILIVFKLWLFRNSLLAALSSAKSQTYSECSKLDQYSTNISNLPYYISLSMNEIISKVLAEANTAFYNGLDLTFTIAEELIMFTIEMTVGTYACILTAAVDGAVDVALNTTESIIDLANDTVIAFADELEDGLGDLTKIINSIIGAIDDVVDFFEDNDDSSDAHDTLRKVNLTIASLKDWSIPSGINAELEKIYKEVPTYDDVLNHTETLIDLPFNKIKSLIQDELDSSPLISASQMYVPDVVKASTYCADNKEIPHFYEDMGTLIRRTFIILITVLIIISVMAMLYFSYKIYSDWNKLNNTVDQLDSVDLYCPNQRTKKLEILEDMRHFWVAKMSSILDKILFSSIKDPQSNAIKTINSKWILHYVFSPTASTILLVSLVGLLSFLVQYILLISVRDIDTSDLKNGFEEVSSNTMKNVNNSINLWANNTNEYIAQQQTNINDNLLGWIHNSSEAINSTVSEFVDSMNDKLQDLFGDTPLYDPIQSIVGCVITDKLIRIEEGLTWINNHTEIELPTINPNVIMKSLETSDNSSSTNTNTNISTLIRNAESELKTTKEKVFHTFLEEIMIELYISLGLLGMWILTLIFALMVIMVKEYHINRGNDDNNKYTHTLDSQISISAPIPLSKNLTDSIYYKPYLAPAMGAPKITQNPTFTSQEHANITSEGEGTGTGDDSQTVYSEGNKENYDDPLVTPIMQNPNSDISHITTSNPYNGPGMMNQTLSRVYQSLKRSPLRHKELPKDQRLSVDSSYPLTGHITPIPFSLPVLNSIPSINYFDSNGESNLQNSSSNQFSSELESPFQLSNNSRSTNNKDETQDYEANIQVDPVDDGDFRSILTTDPFAFESGDPSEVDFSSPSYTDPTIHTARRWN